MSLAAGTRLRALSLPAAWTAEAWFALAGLGLGALAIGPGLAPGYLLSYDMVFVPSPQFNAAMFGVSGVLPRAVPSDAVVAVLARALPADLVQKLVLLAIFVLACSGAARLLAGQPFLGRLAAGIFYAWNPFVAERLLIGQWALLLGYAGLPWVLHAFADPGQDRGRRLGRQVVALLPAAVGGFAAMCVSGLVVAPAAALRPGSARQRLARLAAALGLLGLLGLPWLIPSLTRSVQTSPAGVAAFAARADTPFGTAGSVLMLGGQWNAQAVPAGYGGLVSTLWLLIVVVALAGYLALGRRRWPGLSVAAVAGLLIALLGADAPGRHLLRSMITFWPGFAVLRDAQQFAAPLALAEAAGFGLAVAFVLGRLQRPGWRRDSSVILAAGLAVLPVLFLPGLAYGAAGRLRPVQYPADWLAARRLINSDPHPGKALLLPWGAYRRFGWNNNEAVLDPWPRLLSRDVVSDDGVVVGGDTIPPEDPSAVAINSLVTSAAPLTSTLQSAGYRYVIVDAGFGPATAGQGSGGISQFRGRLPGCRIVLSGPGLVIYLVPAPAR